MNIERRVPPAEVLGFQTEQASGEEVEVQKDEKEHVPMTIAELVDRNPDHLDPEVLKLFELFELEYSEATQIEFETFEPADEFDAGGFYRIYHGEDGTAYPTIFVSEGGHEMLEAIMEIRRTSVERNARTLGISADQMTTRLLHRFILTHELGHVMDYFRNYKTIEGLLPAEAADEMADDRANVMQMLPVPGLSPTYLARELSTIDSLDVAMRLFPVLVKHPDFSKWRTVEDLMMAQEEAYRATSQESYADEFAAMFLRKHAKELGFPELLEEMPLAA